MEEWISLREYSRRREVTLGAVQKAIESRRVTSVRRDDSGRIEAIEYYAATREWNENTDPAQAARSGKILDATGGRAEAMGTIPQPDHAEPRVAGEQLGLQQPQAKHEVDAPASDKDPHGYYEARAQRERFQAKQAELDYLKAIGDLVSREDMKKVAARRYRAIRDQLLNIPDRISAQLAAERDPARIHAAITSELKRVLHELSDDARAETAGGIAERVAA